jgi:uncharacterized protein (DUF4415 family)
MAIIRKTLSQIKSELKNPSKKDLDRIKKLKNMKDEDIDYSDIPDFLSDPDFWKTHSVKKVNTTKKQVNLRLDTEVLDWYKKHGKGYQTLMKQVLESYSKHK